MALAAEAGGDGGALGGGGLAARPLAVEEGGDGGALGVNFCSGNWGRGKSARLLGGVCASSAGGVATRRAKIRPLPES
jgi:hypothetical protein